MCLDEALKPWMCLWEALKPWMCLGEALKPSVCLDGALTVLGGWKRKPTGRVMQKWFDTSYQFTAMCVRPPFFATSTWKLILNTAPKNTACALIANNAWRTPTSRICLANMVVDSELDFWIIGTRLPAPKPSDYVDQNMDSLSPHTVRWHVAPKQWDGVFFTCRGGWCFHLPRVISRKRFLCASFCLNQWCTN